MFTKFHNVSFDATTVTGLELENRILHILTTGQSYEVRFTSNASAEAGLTELTNILNSLELSSSVVKTTQEAPETTKTQELKDTLLNGLSRLQGFASSLKSTATDKVQETVKAKIVGAIHNKVIDLQITKDELMQRAQDLLESLEAAIEHADEEPKPMATRNEPKTKSDVEHPAKGTSEAVERATQILGFDNIFGSTDAAKPVVHVTGTTPAKNLTAEEFKEIFGTPAEPLIGDLSERQLREFIGEFVDNALENERVQQLFQNIKDNFGADEAAGAIDGYKNLILSISLTNSEMKLSDVIARFFG